MPTSNCFLLEKCNEISVLVVGKYQDQKFKTPCDMVLDDLPICRFNLFAAPVCENQQCSRIELFIVSGKWERSKERRLENLVLVKKKKMGILNVCLYLSDFISEFDLICL